MMAVRCCQSLNAHFANPRAKGLAFPLTMPHSMPLTTIQRRPRRVCLRDLLAALAPAQAAEPPRVAHGRYGSMTQTHSGIPGAAMGDWVFERLELGCHWNPVRFQFHEKVDAEPVVQLGDAESAAQSH